VQWLVVTRLIGLAGDESADPRVRAVAAHTLGSLVERIDSRGPVSRQGPHDWAVAQEIRRFLARPDSPRRRAEPVPSPPGDPIGGTRVDDR
jgi:hypothetical protein